MPAKVDDAFAKCVRGIFQGPPPPEIPVMRRNVFEVWNAMAAKFPELYRFEAMTRSARAVEAKLEAFYGVDRIGLANMFSGRLETCREKTVEDALEAWWKEVSA